MTWRLAFVCFPSLLFLQFESLGFAEWDVSLSLPVCCWGVRRLRPSLSFSVFVDGRSQGGVAVMMQVDQF